MNPLPVFNRMLFALAILTTAQTAWPETDPGRQESPSGIRHSFLVTGTTTAALVNEDSEIIWEVKGYSRDGHVLDNGNILISTGKEAREYTAGTYDVVWSYTLAPENKELGTAVRLANGDTMIVERGPKPRIIEVGPDGAINAEVPLQPENDNAHTQTRMARKRANGNYLVPHLGAFKVKEYTPAGEVVTAFPTDLPLFGGRANECWPFTAIELPNGNLWVDLTHSNAAAEFTFDGEVVWHADNTNVDGAPFSDPCGAQVLPNGNIVIGSYAQRDPNMPKIFELTRDREVVWKFFHPEIRAHEIHILTTNGEKVTPVMR